MSATNQAMIRKSDTRHDAPISRQDKSRAGVVERIEAAHPVRPTILIPERHASGAGLRAAGVEYRRAIRRTRVESC